MGSTTASLAANPVQRDKLNGIKLAAADVSQYEGLEHAFRLAVESAIRKSAAVRDAIAAEVKIHIIDVYDDAQAAAGPWPFKRPE